jgi:hypothetical protein
MIGHVAVRGSSDGEEKDRILDGVHIVQDAGLEHQQTPWLQLDAAVGEVQANLPLQRLNGDWPLGSVLLQPGARLQRHENDAQVRLLDEGSARRSSSPIRILSP